MIHTTGVTWRFRLRSTWNLCLDWLFPGDSSACLLCHKPVFDHAANDFSRKEEAYAELTGICPFCLQDAMEMSFQTYTRKLRTRYGWMSVVTAAPYEGIVRHAIRQWKYDGAIQFTSWFARQVFGACGGYHQQCQVAGGTIPAFDMLVPVPTTADRVRKRGYNHVGLLAADLSRRLNLPICHALYRPPNGDGEFTQSQTAKRAVDRKRSLEGAFQVTDGAPIRGKRILLLDDVVTTGATLYHCAHALFDAGCDSVVAFAIAHVL